MMIKVCGISDKINLHEVSSLYPDMLGFIFYPGSPRYMADILKPEDLDGLPTEINKVGVFVDQDPEEIASRAAQYGLQAIQLHGSEQPSTCRFLKTMGCKVIKAWGIYPGFNFEILKAYSSSCDYFLFDTSSEKHGGTGKLFDWNMLSRYTGETPFLLSGGIGPEMSRAVLDFSHPEFAGIDVNSRFEISPGIKDVPLLREFMTKLRQQELKQSII